MIKYNGLILASSSKQRVELLKQINIMPTHIVYPEIDEVPSSKELPKDYSIRIAKEKADKVSKLYPDIPVLSADTVVCCGRRILFKPQTKEQAVKCMNIISGRRHRVYTTVCLNLPNGKFHTKTVLTIIKVKRFSPEELNLYIISEEWMGKAGGFNIQGMADMFIMWLRGSYSSAVGLPLYETSCLLKQYSFVGIIYK